MFFVTFLHEEQVLVTSRSCSHISYTRFVHPVLNGFLRTKTDLQRIISQLNFGLNWHIITQIIAYIINSTKYNTTNELSNDPNQTK